MSDLSFKEFQEFIRRKYYSHDNERGTDGTFMWFMEEVGELASALRTCQSSQATAEDKQNLEEEFADVVGWLSTLANMNGIDLETALRNKYVVHPKSGFKN